MQLTSSAFQAGSAIPTRYTCEGEDISPELSWREAPEQARSLVLILHDPDAPRAGGFTHWVLYNVPPTFGSIEENVPKQEVVAGLGLQGKNDGGKVGYVGPCPPSGKHRYFFRLFALDRELDLAPGASQQQVVAAMENHQIAMAELMGTYARKSERAA
jgi:Raf kinase inhibitor-like YbhB/YbcL family protein